MFTGIVTEIGAIEAVMQRHGGKAFRVRSAYDYETVDIGASIAHAGVCLTVTAKGGDWHEVEAWEEALRLTTLDGWQAGEPVNLERSLKVGDELGGHIVSGHVDGVAGIVAMVDEGDSTRFTFRAPEALARYIAPKGSVALNGTSLTVNEVSGCDFGVNIIPHTKSVTTWGDAAVGDAVNLEIDTLARYVARLREFD